MAFQQITVSELKTLLEQQEITLIDIRDSASFETGHIKNASNVNEGNMEQFVKETDKGMPLVVCCYHGNSSQGAADFMNQKGFKTTYSLAGGFAAWENE